MKKIKEIIQDPTIHIALATGVSILALAYFSKRVLPEPLSYLELALPPFLALFFEGASRKMKMNWYGRSWFGVLIILLATALVIGLNA